MGRRPPRKIDPSLDLSAHLRSLDDLPRPLDPDRLFARPGPLEVEVGSGKGLFLTRASGEHPERNFLGVELAGSFARLAAYRLARLDRPNARVVHGDARRMFAEWLGERTVAAVHVYFPDPWWKKRHHKRRIVGDAFVRDVERALASGGRLHLWTDVPEYFELAVVTIRAHSRLAGPLDVAERPAEHEMDYRTHFERRMRRQQQPVYRAEFRRT